MEHRAFKVEPVATCRPGETIRESNARLIESGTGTIVSTDHADGAVLGFVTLHDLLRA